MMKKTSAGVISVVNQDVLHSAYERSAQLESFAVFVG